METLATSTSTGDGAINVNEIPLERLEMELVSMAPHLAAGEARRLEWLAAYDRRAGWQVWECRSKVAPRRP